MPRSAGTSIENAFNRGLITEVTGVNSPENSVSQTINVIYDRRGRAIKRPPFHYEDGNVFNTIPAAGARTEYLWETVGNSDDISFVVLQFGSLIRFYEAAGDSPLSQNQKSFTVNLLTYKVSGVSDSTVQNTPAQYTTGKGYLFIAHPNCDTIYVKYTSSTDTITTNRITLTNRDFEGVVDNLRIDERPSSLSNAHKYNLYNQGWYASTYTSVGNVNALDRWDTLRTDFPANSDVWWYYTAATDGIGETGGLLFISGDKIRSDTGLYGNTPAAKGHYIVNSFSTNRSSQSGVTVTEKTSSGARPSVVAFFAGRAFYGGVSAQGYNSLIYFSQIIERDDQLGKCYQANDPTSKETFDLLDSDGGVIEIQGIANIIDMKVIGEQIFVFASNGVWAIGGSNEGPFRATDYTVSKVSSYPAISRSNIVEVGSLPVWWNYEGIFTMQKNQVGLTSEVTSASNTTIQEFFDLIPQSCKRTAKGTFNDQSQLIYWIYSDDENSPSSYSNILILDAVSLAFYVFSLPEQGYEISGLVSVRSIRPVFQQDNVVTNLLDQVVVSGPSNVYIETQVGYSAQSKIFKFVTTSGTSMTFSELSGDDYLDWGLYDYEASFVTGYRIRGELLKKFQTNYLTIVTEDVDDGSVMMQPLWDYSNSPDSGRHGNPQQAYRSRNLRDYQRSRLKIRGTGYSLQFRFFGQTGLPFTIIGWAGYETANGVP